MSLVSTPRRTTSLTPPKQKATTEKPRRYAPRLPPEERREQLLDATVSLVAQKGYESVSMEGIARKAGVTKPVVYDLFGSLAKLLEALLAREETGAQPARRSDAGAGRGCRPG